MWNLEPGTVIKLVIPVTMIILGILVGLLAENMLAKSQRKAARLSIDGIKIMLAGPQGLLKIWGLLLGCYGAALYAPLLEKTELRVSKVLMVLMLFTLVVLTARITEAFLNLYTTKVKNVFPSISLITNIIRMMIYILGALMVLQFLGISVAPILTALGVGGLAVALALQDTLSNLFSGIQTIVSRQVKPGDYIKLSTNEEGYVEDITWRNTTIRSLSGNMIIAPNSKISTAIITNYNQPTPQMTLTIEVGIRAESDMEKVEELLLETADAVIKTKCPDLSDFQPSVRYHSFTADGIILRVHLLATEFRMQFILRDEFIRRLQPAFTHHHVDLPFMVKVVN